MAWKVGYVRTLSMRVEFGGRWVEVWVVEGFDCGCGGGKSEKEVWSDLVWMDGEVELLLLRALIPKQASCWPLVKIRPTT